MILLDASVIIDYWKKPSENVAATMEREELCICGITIAELLHGTTGPLEEQRVERMIKAFLPLEMPEDLWPAVGRNLSALRQNGLSVSFQDIVLSTLAIMNDIPIWTRDGHFVRIQQKVLKELKLFDPPPLPAKSSPRWRK
jgi:hypothetical protein